MNGIVIKAKAKVYNSIDDDAGLALKILERQEPEEWGPVTKIAFEDPSKLDNNELDDKLRVVGRRIAALEAGSPDSLPREAESDRERTDQAEAGMPLA